MGTSTLTVTLLVLALALCGPSVLAAPNPTLAVAASAAVPRNVRVEGTRFVLAATGEPVVMAGPNVVMKGPPYIPAVEGDAPCADVVDAKCTATGTCKSCSTFNAADVAHFKRMGWNTLRLGVVWAGAQPHGDADALDPEFLRRLDAILSLCDAHGLHVILDNHGDMVGSAGCGNGVPMWVQQRAAPELIGRPLATGFPYDLVPSLRITELEGYARCGANATRWAAHAGDPDYNLLNECCQAMNSPNPGALGFTTISQKTMDFVVEAGAGRALFVRFWQLLAEAVRAHPSAFAAELMNEPMTIKRGAWYDTVRACAEAINAVVPDMAVSLCDVGESAIVPAWVERLVGPGADISADTLAFIRTSKTLFYAWHWYGSPAKPADAVKSVQVIMGDWQVPSFATEFASCEAWQAAAAANISHTYWHYSSYCNTGPAFGNRAVPKDTFGACILGWDDGDEAKVC